MRGIAIFYVNCGNLPKEQAIEWCEDTKTRCYEAVKKLKAEDFEVMFIPTRSREDDFVIHLLNSDPLEPWQQNDDL